MDSEMIMDYWENMFVITIISGPCRAELKDYHDTYYYGRKPAEAMMNNFRNFKKQDMDFVGGYMAFMGCFRMRGASMDGPEIGSDYKKALSEAGDWGCYMYMQGETVPKETNRVYLSKDKKDAWGIPLLVTDVAYDHNDELLLKDFLEQGVETLSNGGVKDIETAITGTGRRAGISTKWEDAGWEKILKLPC